MTFDQNIWSGNCFKTCGQAFQELDQAFETIEENQKLNRVFILKDGPYCPNKLVGVASAIVGAS